MFTVSRRGGVVPVVEESSFFTPEVLGDKKPVGRFVMPLPLPPPNVTGALQCGHALANPLQEALVRWYRMGYSTLWVPGCDHASISTQSVVKKMLLGREKFTDIVWDWKDQYHHRIKNAQRRLGGSMDWTREAFTMDENLSAATLETFCHLHEGYLYRSNRLVNWCTKLNTAISYDKEVEFGVLTYFKYPINRTDPIEAATTRLETMLGDSGIAVHPGGARYAQLVGKCARHPFTDRLLPIVADK
ncbi:Aminoacyl-tRNA synthetase [Lasiosphaeria hispida]|uniref:valine--tRNA ligase n=1 Tax=Lasiosphaeria hispida TaxID=260671 RepID=A0AAJ0HX28_9PEZI|nr:Aminoacyl-tRNA synthetase [Lasiosphaeria hispida]